MGCCEMSLEGNKIMNEEIIDKSIRHYIYATFAEKKRPPTTLETAKYFDIFISEAEESFERLAEAHHIALAPGSHAVWMAHPFSSVPTNFVTEVGAKIYWGN
jgi:hypothetical protein